MKPRTTPSILVRRAALAAATLLILGLPEPASATVESGSVVPSAPTLCDSVLLVVAGSLSSSCITIRDFRVGDPEPLPTMGPIPTYGIRARIRAEEPDPAIGAACPAVIVPYRLTKALGRLPYGNYWVDATEYLHPFPADSTAPIDSSRVHFTFFVGADTCRTGEGCVLLGFGATGFEGPRLDGCTVRTNPGGTACFDVTLTNPVPVGALQTEITVPLPVPAAGETPLVPVSVIATPRAAGFEAAWTADGSTAKIVLFSATGAVIGPGRGAVLHVCYAVKEGTPEGAYPLRFENSLVASPAAETIPFCPTFAIVSGRICVGVSGCDLNGDGVGDVRDIVRLARCILAPTGTCPDSIRARADCNGDGSLDVRDVVCCVRDVLAHDGGWGPDSSSTGAPPLDAPRIGFDGEASWTGPFEGHAEISIEPGSSFGGLQFVLDPGSTARVRGVAIADPWSRFVLQSAPGGAGGSTRVMIYDRGYTVETGGTNAGAPQGRSGAAAALHLRVTLEPIDGTAEAGAMTIRPVRAAAYDGSALGVQGGVTRRVLPANPMSGAPAILPARPNPFVTGTEISFALPTAGRASVRLFDVAGRLVRTLHEGATDAGIHRLTWDGRDERGRTVGVGIYFVRLTAGKAVRTERILRLR